MNPEQWLSLKWNGGSTMSDRWLNQSKIIQLTTECIENVILFVPYMILILYNFSDRLLKDNLKLSQILMKSFWISFLSSFVIETLQLIFHVGTFQISDLFFNTLGGIAGGIIYFLVQT